MTIPALIFGALLASLYGALYHLARNGAGWRLLFYLTLAWIGFAAGHLAGAWLGWSFLQAGPLNAGSATIGSLISLGLGDWLSRMERTA